MRAGKLDKRIVIQTKTETVDDAGAPKQTWATFATVWASKLDLNGSEKWFDHQFNPEAAAMWKIRNLSGIKREMRISYNSVLYDIIDIKEIGRNVGHVLMTTAFVE